MLHAYEIYAGWGRIAGGIEAVPGCVIWAGSEGLISQTSYKGTAYVIYTDADMALFHQMEGNGCLAPEGIGKIGMDLCMECRYVDFSTQ